MARDKEDLAKLDAKLHQQSPLYDEVTLRNIITGLKADTNVNVQTLFIVGKDAVMKMEGQAVFSYKRTNAVRTLASTRSATVDKERCIDPALLFQRFLMFDIVRVRLCGHSLRTPSEWVAVTLSGSARSQ